MLVGNGVTNWKYDGTPAYFHMSYFFGLVDHDFYTTVNKKCDFAYIDYDNSTLSVECAGHLKKFN
jgi:hypothetical protein